MQAISIVKDRANVNMVYSPRNKGMNMTSGIIRDYGVRAVKKTDNLIHVYSGCSPEKN